MWARDPEIKQLDNGYRIAKFLIETHETYKNRDSVKSEQTELHRIVVLKDALAEIAKNHLNKGRQIYLEGRIRTKSWTDKEGMKRNVTEIVADNIILLFRKGTVESVDNENNGLMHLPESAHVSDENIASVNKVILIGNVGKDPEIRQLESGFKIAKFCLATHETYKNKEGVKGEQTEWHNVVVLRDGLAEIAKKYIVKGRQIYVEGKIKTRTWTEPEGANRYLTEIIADNFILLGNRKTIEHADSERNGFDHIPESHAVQEETGTIDNEQ